MIYDAKIFIKNEYVFKEKLNLETNFDYKRIMSLYSNLSSLNIYQLYELRENYKKLNYSSTEVDLQILKIISFPFYLLLMTLFSASMMLRIKYLNSSTIKILLGLFFSVIIYYVNNFFMFWEAGTSSFNNCSFFPILILASIDSLLIRKINEK